VFYDDNNDLQVQANRGNPALGIVQFAPTNAGTATSKGVEFEFEARPVSSLTLSGGVTYLLTSVNINGLDCILSAQAGAPVITTGMPINTCYAPAKGATPIQNVQDGVLPEAPKWRGDILARYSHDLLSTPLVGFVQASATSQSRFNYTIEQDPLTVQSAYTITNAGIGLRDQNDKYRVMFFADNLFNQHYLSSIARAVTLTTQGLTPNQTTGTVPKDADRYFGVTVSASF
jgi:iron complex outermembrane receptor protein